MDKKFPCKRLEQVRDIFVFSCFCGLAYIDVKNLRENNIRTSFDGNLWIMGRQSQKPKFPTWEKKMKKKFVIGVYYFD